MVALPPFVFFFLFAYVCVCVLLALKWLCVLCYCTKTSGGGALQTDVVTSKSSPRCTQTHATAKQCCYTHFCFVVCLSFAVFIFKEKEGPFTREVNCLMKTLGDPPPPQKSHFFVLDGDDKWATQNTEGFTHLLSAVRKGSGGKQTCI